MRAQVSGKLLATVAASAATVTSTGVVAAHATDGQAPDQTVIDSRIKIAFEGSFFRNELHDGDKIGRTPDKLGNSKAGFNGAVSLTKQISPDLDWRLAGAFHTGRDWSEGGSFTGNTGTNSASISHGFNFQTFDFDVGKRVKVQSADIRFFGGLRLLHADQTFSDFSTSFTPTNPTAEGETFDKLGNSEFWGVGPRVGAEAYYPIGETWGLSGSVAGSVMWGRREDYTSVTLATTNPNFRESENNSQHASETVSNVEASAGLSWTPVTNTTFTAGYKIEQWHNLIVNANQKNQTFDGPFIRIEMKM
ncbi:Lpg1974 family pore-forming outer membrane protein [Mesorhizobium sp.]|uniref:Lpg1974 family pore-forming outer membrane protein n=1 Tax=Mesorhizobium sp. TaxID=1871066 RepID=UPI0025DE34D7|nr:Lpg1974 family pore-forming outer membrane protein [Mesorhizobium sp.]